MHADDNVDAPFSIAWGISIGLIASCVQSLGLTIQRKSHVLNQQQPEHLQRADYRRPLWLLGFAIFISSNILGSIFQIASLPVVILAPLGAVSLLWNAFFARFLLGDVFSWWMLLGTVLIAGGAVLIAIFGIVPEPTHSLDDLLHLFGRSAFIAYFSLLGVALLACLIITHIIEFSLSRNTSPPPTPTFHPGPLESVIPQPLPPPSSQVLSITENTPLLDRKPPPTRSSTPIPFFDGTKSRTRLLIAISYASASGILSGMCLIFAKSGVELIVLTIGGRNQFWRWEAWMLVLGLIVFALLQLWYLQKSLVFADPTIVCPLAFCFYNLSSIVNGLVYFDQVALLSVLQLSLVSVGMVVLLGGVWLVSFHAGSGRVDLGTWQEGDDDIEEEEESEITVQAPSDYASPVFSPVWLDSALSDSGTFHRTPLSPHTIAFPTSPESSEQEHEQLAQSLTLSPSTSRARHQQQRRRHRFSILQPSEATMPGGSFSIGLSPASPGFAIVPKRRIGTRLRSIVRRAAMRRTVSESDADPSRSTGVQRDTVAGVVAGSNEVGQRIRANARWKWLRSVFNDGDS
ncbi:uncharacterized protein FOMMEDRAFT_19273 [Fomitiporia mediterranea MF3/22]|uniref:uncharacterized protein n=1 Tax=Fomitiporia mediterranea (strain MF3/22) TaxID=694068 RepID=UPI0004409C3A|nr:uncharacterized protein FOMMEDRAFT_19273 [Fomitiporia mediterranea MF3/22]EJD03961.1 hypothetical protein FOMMEDRAFT_19273 [Fomitiporia mediterranea MF3/22]